MKIAVLSNSFKEYSHQEVEKDLNDTGRVVRAALKQAGHDVHLYSVNKRTFEKLRKSNIDFAFNVCERFNGSSLMEPHVAAMLELLQIPYTGSGPLALSLCMNKPRVKEILAQNGIPTPRFQVFYSKDEKLDKNLKFPLFVKPACMDNSIGINEDAIVRDKKELRSKIESINRAYNQPALVEEFIEGREFAVAVIGNKNPIALPIAEVKFNIPGGEKNIFSYPAKWFHDDDGKNIAYESCPADIPKSLELYMKRIAVDVYNLLEVRDYGRIDIRISKDGIPHVLEMNPNPGISSDNVIPKAAKSIGLTHYEMINEIMHQAFKRHKMKASSKIAKLWDNAKSNFKVKLQLVETKV